MLILREGWVIRRIGGLRTDYYEIKNQGLVPLQKLDAELLGYSACSKAISMQSNINGNFLYIDLRNISLPTPHYHSLVNLASQTYGPNGAIEVLAVQLQKKKEVEEILDKIGIVLSETSSFIRLPSVLTKEESTAYQDLLKQISETFSLSYSVYLKCEDRIEQLILDVSHRDWASVGHSGLKLNLQKLASLVDQGNGLAEAIYSFIVDRLPIYYDWEDRGKEEILTGLIVDGTPLEYLEAWSTNYFKVIMPNLETSLYWQTTLSSDDKGPGRTGKSDSRLLGLSIRRWRVYPYLGKLKLTGTRKDVNFYGLEPHQIRNAFYAAVGIPSFEIILRDFAYLDGYNLDYKTWRGGYIFNRYFLGILRIDEGISSGRAVPTTLATDIFGNHFQIRWDINDYLYESDRVHSMQKGGWISVMLENELNAVDPDRAIPIFRTAQTIGSRFVKKDEAYYLNVLSIIKYCGFISNEGLVNFGDLSEDKVAFWNALEHLISDGRVVVDGDLVFYVHNSITKEQAESIAELTTKPNKVLNRKIRTEPWYESWSRLRSLFPLIHPLIRGTRLFQQPIREQYQVDSQKYQLLYGIIENEQNAHIALRKRVQSGRLSFLVGVQKSDIKFFETCIGKKDVNDYVKQASLMVQNYGYSIIKARGRWVSKAHQVARKVECIFAYADPIVKRKDTIELNLEGRAVPSVEFIIGVVDGLEGEGNVAT